jgi:hypothetical protein
MSEQTRRPLLPCADLEEQAEARWRPYYKSLPLSELWAEAQRIGANTFRVRETDRVKLINRLVNAKRAEVAREWSRKISTGLYEVRSK